MLKRNGSDAEKKRKGFVFLYQIFNFYNGVYSSEENGNSKMSEEIEKIVKDVTNSEVSIQYDLDSMSYSNSDKLLNKYKRNSNKTSIFIVSKYILMLSEQMNSLIGDCNLFEKNVILNEYSLTSHKLQKLIIISVLDYLHSISQQIPMLKDDLEFVNDFNPIANFTSIVYEKCGYSINYRFSQFGLSTIYNYHEKNYSDYDKSLADYLIDKENRQKLFDWFMSFDNNLSVLDQYIYSSIPADFKNSVIHIFISYILFKPYSLGQLLDNTKPKELEAGTPIKLSDVFRALESKSTERYLFERKL